MLYYYAMLAMPQNSTIMLLNVMIMLELCFCYYSNNADCKTTPTRQVSMATYYNCSVLVTVKKKITEGKKKLAIGECKAAQLFNPTYVVD